jgi:hypothetical protein
VVLALALAANGLRYVAKPRGVIVSAVLLGVACLLWWAWSTPVPTAKSQVAAAVRPSSRPGPAAIQASRQPLPAKPFEAAELIEEPTLPADSSLVASPVMSGFGTSPISAMVGPVPDGAPSLLPPVVPIPSIPVTLLPPGTPKHAAAKPSHTVTNQRIANPAPNAPAARPGGVTGSRGGIGRVAQGGQASASNAAKSPSLSGGMIGMLQSSQSARGNAPQMTAGQKRNAAAWDKFWKGQQGLMVLNNGLGPILQPYVGGGKPATGGFGRVTGGMSNAAGGANHAAAKQHHR